MSNDLWLGAIISIPISIGSALVVPSIQRWWVQRGKQSHAKRIAQAKDEYDTILYYALHPDMMIANFVLKGIFVTLYGVYLIFLLLLPPFFTDVLDFLVVMRFKPPKALIFCLSGLFLALLSGFTVYIVMICRRSLLLYLHVRYFEGYVERLPNEVRRTRLEGVISAARWNRAIPGLNTLNEKEQDGGETPSEKDFPNFEEPGG